MEINGRKLQKELLDDLKLEIDELGKRGIEPCIGIVTLGPEDSWEAYVAQKLKLAEKLGIKTKFINLRPKTTEEVVEIVKELNANNTIDGLIVQRPFPTEIDTEKVIQSISKDKDIDGFLKDSQFEVPAWLAVKHILTHIAYLLNFSDLLSFLSNQSIVVVGKGGTAGTPVIEGLRKLGFEPNIIDSKTENRAELFKNSDIIISAVGKKNIIPVEILKEKSILIGVGTHGEDGRLTGDFDQEKAKEKGLIYTPTPGGVGPVNLAFLFDNLVKAASRV
jgi:methylenetetrahydrofolate dehydrogenase (NADP+)/methenyltetrahydrofolate cyclohydrolase